MRRSILLALAAMTLLTGCAQIHRMARYKDPLNGSEHYQLGAAYEQKGELAAAEREYRAATRRDKKSLPAHIALGNVTFAQGNHKEAEKSFRRALGLAKDNPAASNNLAMLYASQGRKLKDAEKLATRAAADERFRPYALDTLATIYAKQGRTEEARSALDEARSIAPAGDPGFLANLDRTEQSLGEAPAGGAGQTGGFPVTGDDEGKVRVFQ